MSADTDFLEGHLDALLSVVSSRNAALFVSARALAQIALLLKDCTYRAYSVAGRQVSQTKTALLVARLCALEPAIVPEILRVSQIQHSGASSAALAALHEIIQNQEGRSAALQENAVGELRTLIERFQPGDQRLESVGSCLQSLQSST